MARATLVIILAVLYLVSANDFVANVKQNYDVDINKLLSDQTKAELSASYIYQGYASYFQRADVSLPGISKFFSEASLEERAHAQSLIDYINKRGGSIKFDDVNLLDSCKKVLEFSVSKADTNLTQDGNRRFCICGFVAGLMFNTKCDKKQRDLWYTGLMAFEDALLVERFVNQQLLDIHKEADAKNDTHLTHILEHEFLEEQVNSINKLAHYVTRLKSFTIEGNYKLGEYIFDQHM